MDGWTNVDVVPSVKPDILHDLNKFPYPFDSDSVDGVLMDNSLEHLNDVTAVLREVHRILKLGATAHIIVPYAFSDGAMFDPTHRHFFCPETFDYYSPNGPPYTALNFLVSTNLICLNNAIHFKLRNLLPFRSILTKFIRNMYDGIEAKLTKIDVIPNPLLHLKGEYSL